MRVNFYTNVNASQIKKKDGDWHISGVPMTVDGAVMNRVQYPADENKAGLNSYKNKTVLLDHPFDEQGQPTDAQNGYALKNQFSGGYIANTYNQNGVNYADLIINEAKLKANGDIGEAMNAKFEAGEAVGVSTGLFFSDNGEKGEGYDKVARNQQGDHLALLPDNKRPAGGDATVIRFNSEEYVNIDSIISGLNSEDKTLFDKISEWCKRSFAPIASNEDNSQEINNNSEGDAMRETLEAVLKAKGITVNAEMTDAEVLAKYNEANTPDISAAVNAAIKPLTEKLTTLETELAANADKELDELAEKTAKLLGIDAADAKAMGANAMHKVLTKNGVVVGAPIGAENSDNDTTVKMPWEE